MAGKEEVVLDASVLVQWYLIEQHSAHCLRARDAYVKGAIQVHVPDLVYYEVCNALKYSSNMGCEELITAAKSMALYGFDEAPFAQTAEETLRLSKEFDISVYDASYVALARKSGAVMYTCDEKLLKKFSKCCKHISEFQLG